MCPYFDTKLKESEKKIKVVQAPPETVVFYMGRKPVTRAMLEQWAREDTIALYRQQILERSKVPEKYLRALVRPEEEAIAKMGKVIGKKGVLLVRQLPKDYPVLKMHGKVYTAGELEEIVKKDRKLIEKILKKEEKKK